MSNFFHSEIVQQTLSELDDLQKKLLIKIFDVPYSSIEEKREYVQTMRDFLEKQKVLLFRMSLSDDPEAQETKERILESAKIFGLKENQGLNDFFEMLENPIRELEKNLDI